MTTLKPCPFCGGGAEYNNADDVAWAWIECKSCGARGEGTEYGDPELAWNRRTPSWQPIESAPKGGTPILGWWKGTYATVYWDAMGNTWELCEAGSYADDGEWWPTHWMPLPEPPEGK